MHKVIDIISTAVGYSGKRKEDDVMMRGVCCVDG